MIISFISRKVSSLEIFIIIIAFIKVRSFSLLIKKYNLGISFTFGVFS